MMPLHNLDLVAHFVLPKGANQKNNTNNACDRYAFLVDHMVRTAIEEKWKIWEKIQTAHWENGST